MKEIDALYATNDTDNYKSHPSISTNEYTESARNLDLVIDNVKSAICPCPTNVKIANVTGRKCPHCGESYYMENYSESTAMHFPPIYKNGVNINPDRNTTTTHCTCMNFGKDFSFEW